MSSGASDEPRIGSVQGVKPPGIRELTPRSIACGLVVAAIMGASYPYMVLKLGFGPNVSVVAAFFGYLALGIVFRNYNRWENNMVQTAGTAGAQTAFMCVLLAAFDMLAASPNVSFSIVLSPLQSFLWLTTAGLLGVLLAVPMRQHFIVDEKLTYADGVAAGETLIVLDSRGGEATRAARALALGVLASAAVMLMTEDALVLKWFPSTMLLGTAVTMQTGVGLNWSLLSLGSGMLVGMRINASMLLGTIVGWMIAPYLLLHYGVIPATFTRTDVLFWVMWPATAMMVSGGLTALALRWSILKRTFSRLSGARADVDDVSAAVGRGWRDRAQYRVDGAAVADVWHRHVADGPRHPALAAADARRAARAGRDELGPDQPDDEHDAGHLRGDRARQPDGQHGRRAERPGRSPSNPKR